MCLSCKKIKRENKIKISFLLFLFLFSFSLFYSFYFHFHFNIENARYNTTRLTRLGHSCGMRDTLPYELTAAIVNQAKPVTLSSFRFGVADFQDVEQPFQEYGTFNGIFARNGVFACALDDECFSNLVTVQHPDSDEFEQHWDDTRFDQLFTSPDGGIHVVGTDSTKRYNDLDVEFELIQIGHVLAVPRKVYSFSTVICK